MNSQAKVNREKEDLSTDLGATQEAATTQAEVDVFEPSKMIQFFYESVNCEIYLPEATDKAKHIKECIEHSKL